MKTIAVLLLLMLSLEASAQTIADIARRERGRQKQVQSLNQGTYTNSITPDPTEPARGAEAATATETTEKKEKPAEAAASKPTGPVDNQGRDEKWWRDEFQKTRTEMKRAEDNVQVLEGRIRDLNTQVLRQSDIYNRENVLGAQINATQRELETAKRDAEAARTKVTNLEEQLRRSGGLPGWAR